MTIKMPKILLLSFLSRSAIAMALLAALPGTEAQAGKLTSPQCRALIEKTRTEISRLNFTAVAANTAAGVASGVATTGLAGNVAFIAAGIGEYAIVATAVAASLTSAGATVLVGGIGLYLTSDEYRKLQAIKAEFNSSGCGRLICRKKHRTENCSF